MSSEKNTINKNYESATISGRGAIDILLDNNGALQKEEFRIYTSGEHEYDKTGDEILWLIDFKISHPKLHDVWIFQGFSLAFCLKSYANHRKILEGHSLNAITDVQLLLV